MSTKKIQILNGASIIPQSDWNQADDTKVDYIKNKPTIYDTEWQTGTSNLSNVTVQYKKNGNLVTVRFSGSPSSSISTGTKIGSVPYACGDINSYLGTHFAVGTWGSGIYDIQMRGTDIYFYQMLYGTNDLYLYLNTFQFTYSI